MHDTGVPLLLDKNEINIASLEQDIGVVELILALKEIDLLSPTALLNEYTIADNNGGRIEL